MPPVIKAIEFNKTFFDRMQMNMIVFLDKQIDLFQVQITLLDSTYKAIHKYNELE